MAESETKSPEKPKRGMSVPMVIALVGGVALLQVVLFVLLFRLFVAPSSAGPEKASEAEAAHAAPTEPPSGVIVPVEDLVVNPRGSSSRYVLIALGLEVADAKQGERLRQELMNPARDRKKSVVTSYSIEELQASGARDSLRAQIRQELAQVLPGVQLRNVYFSKFVIQ
ncbi:MAG: flagellar basal body-associated FliL family protein [Bacteroidota bacterium]|nr:flagellar basal body-associated FliL family protein [Bacteroidota bacterium]